MPGHHWESDTPSYKIKIHLDGDKATMYFECHYIDPKTSKVLAVAGVTHNLQKVNGQWLITTQQGRPPRSARNRRMAQPDVLAAPPTRRGWAALGATRNRLVRLVARVPAKVRTKLLVAFLAIAALLVLVGVLGLQVLGQANARVEGWARSSSVRRSTKRSSACHDLKQTLGVRAAGTPALTPYTGGKALRLDAQWTLTDLHDRRHALPGRARRRTRCSSGSCRRPPTNESSRQIRLDYRTVARALTQIQKLDAAGATRVQGPIRSWRCDQAPATTSTRRANDLAFRTSAQTQALVAANRGAYASSRNLFIARQRGERHPRARTRPRPLLVADRADPDDGGASRRDRCRATSRDGWTSRTATSSARSPRT